MSGPARNLPQIQTGGQSAADGSADDGVTNGDAVGDSSPTESDDVDETRGVTISGSEDGEASESISQYDSDSPLSADQQSIAVDDAATPSVTAVTSPAQMAPETTTATDTPSDDVSTATTIATQSFATADDGATTTTTPSPVGNQPPEIPESVPDDVTTAAQTTTTLAAVSGPTGEDGASLIIVIPDVAIEPVSIGRGPNLLKNGSFENGAHTTSASSYLHARLPYWESTDRQGQAEVWRSGHNGFDSFEGDWFVELNGFAASTLTSTVSVTPGARYYFSFVHRMRNNSDTVEMLVDGVVIATVTTTTPDSWFHAVSQFSAPIDRSTVTIGLRAFDHGTGGNLVDDIQIRLAN